MEQHGRRRNSPQQHHQAVDGLLNFFTKSQHDLSLVHHKLEKEYQQLYPENANPMKLVSRIKKVEEDLLLLNDQCRELLAAKQNLIDKARSILVINKSVVQRMQTVAGIPTTADSDDPAYTNFKQVIEEWTTHVRSRTVGDQQDEEEEDINKLIFSSIKY